MTAVEEQILHHKPSLMNTNENDTEIQQEYFN